MYQDINGGGFFQDESGLNHLNEEGLANLERFNQMLVNGSNGQGDADLAAQTNQLTLVNGEYNFLNNIKIHSEKKKHCIR